MENPIKIRVPIAISYPALQGVLQKQLVGEVIPKPEAGNDTAPYAKILNVAIAGSSTEAYDLDLRVKLRILRTVLKRDEVDLHVLAAVGYDNAAQQLFVRKFRLKSLTSSGFYNTALEVLANKVAYTQILNKARVHLNEIISAEIEKVNGMLEKGLDVKGATLLGKVKEVTMQDIVPQPDQVTLTFELQGSLEVSISDLLSLMPA
ncbi:DUF4403 family protein [Pontibacter sp. E15-1]|uniref:DUF4403 family protein n=1 Tax=Pontibacter sp. E15-1 TaxID=2919918 RepID=UPI001F4F7FF9|nr:DUF4403 family protein [Pontibacter sp. E15-1]MCJ8164672.1 DUF4403 family protein [Pontibacter sp. E15-1]